MNRLLTRTAVPKITEIIISGRNFSNAAAEMKQDGYRPVSLSELTRDSTNIRWFTDETLVVPVSEGSSIIVMITQANRHGECHSELIATTRMIIRATSFFITEEPETPRLHAVAA